MAWLTRAASRSSTHCSAAVESARPAVDVAARTQGALVGQAQQRPGKKVQLVGFGGVQGLRAAAPCLACKERCYDQQLILWDTVKVRLG